MKTPNITGKELFKWLVANKAELIDAKKAATKHADATSFNPLSLSPEVSKGKYLYEDDEDGGSLKRTIVANTYNYLDSHGDVHLEGIFTNSIEQRKNRPAPHLYDHNFSVLSKVGKSLNYTERKISWRELGLGKTGMTTALVLESEIKRGMNERVFDAYLNGEIDQHSVAMRYINVSLAVNDEEEYPNEYKVWQEVIGKVGNRQEAEKKGYFWAVREAALLETSAVLEGSNVLTPTLGKTQPSEDIEEKAVQPPFVLNRASILLNYL